MTHNQPTVNSWVHVIQFRISTKKKDAKIYIPLRFNTEVCVATLLLLLTILSGGGGVIRGIAAVSRWYVLAVLGRRFSTVFFFTI